MYEWIRNLKIAPCLVLAMLFGGGSMALATTGQPELDQGLARFALDTGDDAAALHYTRTLNSEHGALIRARALLNSGRQAEALALLDELIAGDYVRGEAALLKSTQMAGDDHGRIRLRELASQKGHGEVRQQALYQRAETARISERPETAGQILATMVPGYWAALGYLNIAADYGKRDRNPSRALIALRVALAMAEEDQDRPRREALKAQILIRAGLLAFEDDDYDKAINFLEKVSLDSYPAPQALYLHGLALSAKGKQRDALQSWHRAQKYPLAFPGVAESWLGKGRGYDLAGYLGQAGEAYLAASARYESERVTLRELAEQIREKGAFDGLLADASDTQSQWFLAEDHRLRTQPRGAHLLRFMEDPGAQAAVRRVTDLQGIRDRMARQQRTLEVFQGALEERLADSTHQAAGLPDGFEPKLEILARRLAAIGQDVLRGSDRAETISQLSFTVADLQASAARFGDRLGRRDQRLGQLARGLDSALTRIGKLRPRVLTLLHQASADLDRRLLSYVEAEAQRMARSLEQAEQQVAHLYEYLALKSVNRRAP